MNRTRSLFLGCCMFLFAACDADGDTTSASSPGTSSTTVSSSSAGADTSTSGGATSGEADTGGSSSSSTSGQGSTTIGPLDPYEACRSWPDPETCPPSEDIGLMEPQDCKQVDIYVYESPGVCTREFERRCEVLASRITGGPGACSFLGYSEGWFRELDDGSIEFWGVQYSGDNPPVEPGFTRCLEQPEMCACECEEIQPD